jgi:C4-dicarboxylate transporter DctQ subunit
MPDRVVRFRSMAKEKRRSMKKRKIGPEEVLLCVMMSFLIVLMFIQVVFRYCLGRSITWSEEVSRLLFVWSVFLGIDLAAKYNRHIRVTFQLKLFAKPVQKGITIFAYFIWFAFSLILSIVAIEFVITMFKFPYFSQTLHINLAYAYVIVPLGFSLVTLRVTRLLIEQILGRGDILESDQPVGL